MTPSMVALIPARKNSKRCPGKNTRLLGGKPLIQWTIEAALDSGIFGRIYLCSDDGSMNAFDTHHVALMPREPVPDDQPDIVWVRDALNNVPQYDVFAILRPTSPFRTADTIRRAWKFFSTAVYDSIRAVELVKQHPGKMWTLDNRVYGGRLVPLLDASIDDVPWHSCPTQVLPACYVQNASLEMAWTKTVREQGTISGTNVGPFFTKGLEGFDINTEEDFARAEQIVAERAHAATA